MRVRPKLMTVSTMLVGLIPLLWATGSGADVMKRIAAPMVGGLITSAFLTLEIIPVISTYWRYDELLWQKLAERDERRLARLRLFAIFLWGGFAVLAATLLTRIYVEIPPALWALALAATGAAIVVGIVGYVVQRRRARAIIWPALHEAAGSLS